MDMGRGQWVTICADISGAVLHCLVDAVNHLVDVVAWKCGSCQLTPSQFLPLSKQDLAKCRLRKRRKAAVSSDGSVLRSPWRVCLNAIALNALASGAICYNQWR